MSSSDLKSILREKRPNLSDKSIATYSSILRNIMKNMLTDNVSKLDESSKVLDYLDEFKPSQRKTKLSALVVLTDNDEYRDQMLNDIRSYNDSMKSRTKSDKEAANWVSQPELDKIYKDLKTQANALFKKSELSKSDLQTIQNYVILSLYTLIPPRRSLDYTEMKINNIDKKQSNYINGKKFIFNTYKTSRVKGQDNVQIPTQLKTILNKWIKINPTDYLLFDNNGGKLTPVKLNQRFEKLFGKKFSTSMIRKLHLSSNYGATMKKMDEMASTMKSMGSSSTQINHYVKK